MVRLPFANRLEAGRLLATELSRRRLSHHAVILALARGGVPVGYALAEQLNLPLDVIAARKLGVPWQPELAMGAMAGNVRLLDTRLIAELGISDAEVEQAVAREQAEMKRREAAYRGDRPALHLAGKTAILADDGLATGSTMLAAVRHVRTLKPARVIIAVPTGSRQACDRLIPEADELVCLSVPEPFCAVGEWYLDFRQVEDDEVREFLACNHRRLSAGTT